MKFPVLGAVLGCLVTPASAEPQTIACPPAVMTKSAVSEAPQGWEAGLRTTGGILESTFLSATFSVGHPSNMAFLIPSGEQQREGAPWDAFSFEGMTAESGVWIVCQYAGTAAFVSRKLDSLPNICMASRGGNAETAAVCE